MRDPAVSRAKRITAGIMALMMLGIVLLSVCFLAAEADHDCAGEDCPICACMQQCGNTLRRFCGAAAALRAAAAPVVFLLVSAALCAFVLPLETLVSSRIRLND